MDGYFVHFFAPSSLKALPKHVVFVLDTSGSMAGTRLEQTKQAMESILDQLRPEDVFSVVEFSSDAKVSRCDCGQFTTDLVRHIDIRQARYTLLV